MNEVNYKSNKGVQETYDFNDRLWELAMIDTKTNDVIGYLTSLPRRN
jgi:hypothetical protein